MGDDSVHDQANKLRHLVLQAALENVSTAGPSPQLLVATGGKGGVGTTTLSINLAVALAQQGKRVVLVDADLRRGDVAALCGLADRPNVADVMTAGRSVHEALQRGPAGIHVLAGAWAPGKPVQCTEHAQRRLLGELKSLGRHADLVLLDVGSGSSDVVRRHWQAADRILLVTTPEPVSMMDAYATIKVLTGAVPPAPIHTIVNRTDSDATAAEVHRRIDVSCRRFLGFGIAAAGPVPLSKHVADSAQAEVPLLAASPTCAAARAVDRIAAVLTAGAEAQQAANAA